MIEMSPITRPDDSMNQSAVSLVRTHQLVAASENDDDTKPTKMLSEYDEQALTEKNRTRGKMLSDLEKIVDGKDD